MDSVQISLLVLGLICVLSVQTGNGEETKPVEDLMCYVCNSAEEYEGKECADSFDKAMGAKFLKNCTEQGDGTKTYTMCRKMTQTIEGKDRIVRQCAENGRNECIDRTGTKAIKITYCECEGAGCNSANQVFSMRMFLLTISSAILALICHS